jgi:hypothetical protein
MSCRDQISVPVSAGLREWWRCGQKAEDRSITSWIRRLIVAESLAR